MKITPDYGKPELIGYTLEIGTADMANLIYLLEGLETTSSDRGGLAASYNRTLKTARKRGEEGPQ